MIDRSPTTRQIWAQTCNRIAWIVGAFTIVLGVLLIVNSTRLYSGPGNGKVRLVEAHELAPLKAALRQDPKNDALKQKIRQIDQRQRYDYFHREMLANRAGWSLLASAVIFLIALQLATWFKQPAIQIPKLTARREDPSRTRTIAAGTVAGTTLGLAALGTAFFWNIDRKWTETLREIPVATEAPKAPIQTATLPSDDEIAKNWPRFRGPGGAGITRLTDLPETWDAPSGKNLLWKTELELPGENSPIIWDNLIFLSGADEKARELYCYDATTGSLRWKTPISTPQSERAEPPEVMEDTGFAASTAATNGQQVFTIFANGDLAAVSFEGKRLWARSLGSPENMYGHATSLMTWKNLVIVVYDQADTEAKKSKIHAFDSLTGEPAWSTDRPVPNSWVTPILINHDGREQIITSADPWVISYDPATGKELWKAECMRGDIATSPAYANGLVYVGCDQSCVAAIRPDGDGNVTETKIVWKNEDEGLPDMCSMLCDGPRVYTLVFGVLHGFDALTGKHLWAHETNVKFEASPTLINGRIHLLSTEGVTIIGEASNEGFKEINRAAVGEETGASPAFLPGKIYLRGKKHLFCIGKKDGN